jgi:hypothetical protein
LLLVDVDHCPFQFVSIGSGYGEDYDGPLGEMVKSSFYAAVKIYNEYQNYTCRGFAKYTMREIRGFGDLFNMEMEDLLLHIQTTYLTQEYIDNKRRRIPVVTNEKKTPAEEVKKLSEEICDFGLGEHRNMEKLKKIFNYLDNNHKELLHVKFNPIPSSTRGVAYGKLLGYFYEVIAQANEKYKEKKEREIWRKLNRPSYFNSSNSTPMLDLDTEEDIFFEETKVRFIIIEIITY